MSKTLLERLLEFYNIDEKTYNDINFDVTPSNFLEGHSFSNVKETSDFIDEAIAQNDKIFIYGDYDADGIMGTSILLKALSYKGVNASYYIPNRYKDGYGITLEKAKEIIDNGFKLVITIDNGISAFEAIEYLKSSGIKVVVMDHHAVQEQLPKADHILHPFVSNLGEVATSGAMVAFIFSITFLNRFDKYLSTLASISLISDMMPLLSYNRNLLRLVIKNYQDNEFLQLDLLKEEEPYSEISIGMKIAPKINAVGRLIDGNEINDVVKLFITNSPNEIYRYIDWINLINEERKTLSKEAIENLPEIDTNQKCILVVGNFKEGLLGLIANHICSKYRLPTIIFTLDGTGEAYKGSCRAPEGFNVVDAFSELKDLLLTYGGHALAGGCSVSFSNYKDFEKAFNEYCNQHPLVKQEKKTIPFGLVDITYENYQLIQTFAPFGENWPSPLFFIKRINTASLHYSRTNEHILSQIGQSSRITGFNFSRDYVSQFNFIDIIGNLRLNNYRGNVTTEFLIKEIQSND